MYKVLDICNYIIYYSNKKDYDINNLKLQCLLYFIQSYFLLEKNDICFYEDIKAEDFGPIIPEAYCYYKDYGANNIPFNKKESKMAINRILNHDKQLINDVIDMFRRYSTYELIDSIHKQSPWIQGYYYNFSNIITIESIQAYFTINKKGENNE